MAALNSVSSTLATIADVVMGTNGTRNLTNAMNNKAKHEFVPIDESDIFYEAAFVARLLGTVYVLCRTATEKKCEGFSYKTQFLFFLSSIVRFMDVEEARAMVFFIPKITQLFVDAATFVVVCGYKSKKNDRFEQIRVGLLVIGCVYMAQIKVDTSFRSTIATNALMFEAVALLPQYILVEKTMYLSNLALWFVHLNIASQIMHSFHLYRIFCYGYGVAEYDSLCREMLSRMCILVLGMLIFLNYMKAMVQGFAFRLKGELEALEANNGHDEDCPQKDLPVVIAVTEDFYNGNKTPARKEESK